MLKITLTHKFSFIGPLQNCVLANQQDHGVQGPKQKFVAQSLRSSTSVINLLQFINSVLKLRNEK